MYLEILQKKKKKKSASSATFPDLRCPRLTLHKGRVRYKNDTLGSVARYRCNSPYRIVGSRRRTCRGNGQWEGETPTCSKYKELPKKNCYEILYSEKRFISCKYNLKHIRKQS